MVGKRTSQDQSRLPDRGLKETGARRGELTVLYDHDGRLSRSHSRSDGGFQRWENREESLGAAWGSERRWDGKVGGTKFSSSTSRLFASSTPPTSSSNIALEI